MVKYETELCDLVYPVGSIYMSVNSTNPQYLFGGEWVQIKDTFLLACGNDYNNGQTGGESTHTLTVDEMPSHTHIQNSHNHTQNSHNHTQNAHKHIPNGDYDYFLASAGDAVLRNSSAGQTGTKVPNLLQSADGVVRTNTNSVSATNQSATATNQSATATNQNEGGDQEHNNMPPYLAVYVWKRKS